MNEEAIKDSYNVFVSQGYTKSIDEYKKLIATNPDALNDSYNAFKGQGYNKSINEYKTLMGIGPKPIAPVQKKKFASELSSEDGSLVSQKSPKPNMPVLTQEGFEQAMTKKKAVPTDMSGKALMKPASEIKKIKEKAAVLKGANKKSLETESPLEGAYPQAPLSEPIATLVSGVPGVPKIPTLTETIGVPTKKIIEQEYKDLDLDNPAPYLSASTYNRPPVNGITINKDNFIEEVFTDEKLINLGIDPADFDGYLNLSGFKEDYNKRKDRGDFEVGSVKNPKLNEELYKSKLLSNYVRTKNDREVLKSKLQSVKASYEGKKIPVNKNAKVLDNNLIAKYTEENLPVLYKKLKEKDQLNKEKYKELTQDNTGLNSFAVGTKNFLISSLNGFLDALNKTSATVYDALGAEYLAEDVRYLNEERQLERPSERQVSFASGKVVDLAGKKYLVDEKGTVYDKDNEIVVNDLIEEGSLNKILEEAKTSKEEDWFFSPQGTAVQTGSVLGDMIWQVAYQAAVGRATRGANLYIKGLSKLSIPKGTADAIIAQSSLGYAQAYQTTLKEARDSGLTDKEAEQIAGDAAQRTAIWYGLTAPISPQTKAVESLFGSAEKELIKKAVNAYKTNGKQGFVSTLNNGLKQIPRKAVGIIEEGGKETIQENIQQAGESLWINAKKNIEAGREISDETMSFDDFMNTSILSFLSGGIASNLSMPSISANKKTQVKNLYQLSQDMDVLDANLNEMVNNNIISKEDANNVKKDAIAVSRNITRIPKDTSPEIQLDVMRKLNEIDDLENSKNTLDKSFHAQIDEKIQEKRNEVKEIYDISLTKPIETDAVQEQSTTEVPVQSETITSETLETGVPQPGPEVITEQVTQEVTPSETITTAREENKIESVRSNFENGNLQNIEINPTRQGFEGDFLNDYDFLAEGSEHTVYRSKDGKTVIKIGEPYGSNEGFMPRVEDALTISNLIGDGSLEVIGYYESNGVKNPIYQQNYIDGKTMTQEEVASHLESKGFVNLGNNKFAITVDGKTYEISDTSDNFIIDNQGNVSAIDAGIMELDVNKLTEEQKSKLKETTAQEVVTPTEQVVEAEVAPVVEEVNELLTLDTKDKTNLKRIYDYLDNLDSALDLDPNELNDVTRVMAIGTAKAVVKTLKELVNVGITLQEAINRAAEIHSVKTEDVLKAFQVIKQGGKQKSAPSPVKSDIYLGEGRLISIAKDIKKITMTEKALLVKQIRDKITGAKDVIKTTKEISQQLVKDIKELESTGKITPTQALNMISKFNKVNMLNEVSVSNFIDYMSKVFADADYDNKINVAKGKLKAAKKNIYTKIGIADGLVGPLQKLFAINPELIPESYLEKYLELVDMFGARKAVLNLEEKSKVTKDVIEILDEINNERSAVDELSERLNYSDNKVIEDDKLSYTATVKNMLKEGEINEEEAALMTKYKSEIAPKVKREEKTAEEIQEEKDQLLAEVKKSTINADDLPTRTERDAAKKLATLIKSPGVKELSNAQLKNLLKVIDNINNGYFAHSAHLIIEEINSINNSKVLESSVNKAKLLPLSKLYSQAKSILTRKDAVLEMIRRNPLFNIDQVLGDFKTKDVFNSILEKAAEAEAKFTAELKSIQLKLANTEEKIAKSFKLDPNKTLMSKFKIMTYMVQLEYESNPDSKQVNPASKFIEATINHINEGKSQFGEKDAEMLQDILDNYTDADGNIDIKKLYNSFNSAEKAGVKTIQEVNQSLKEKAEYTASVIRGQRINPLSNYIHLNVLSDTKPNDLTSGESFADQYNNSLKPSTKAKSLIERTGKVSPLNFDVFASAQKGAKSVLMDYHLTEPIRTGRKTINKTIASLGKIDKEKRRIINAINKSFEESVENLVNNSYIETSVGDDVADYIKKQGYRSVLAGTGRFAAEFLSNIGFVIISDPITFAEGLKYTSILMSPDAPSIMNNVNSKEINRIFPSDTLSGRLIDTNILSEANGIKGGKAKNRVINKAQQIWNLTGKKYKNAVELTADVLITTPDKAIMRPIWFGSFATNFKKETGKDVDFEKIAANDEAYISENKEAIDKSRDAADERSVITGASNNAFTGILKGTSKPNQSNFIKGFNNFNNFMSRFLIYEYTSARTGIMAAMGNGSLSRKEGIALLGAVTTRMTVYSLLAKALGGGLIGLLFGDDDEEDEKSLDKSIGQALTSTFTSLLFNRDFGNATKSIINYGLERINENYLQALREGDYDPYKDAIQYSTIPVEKKGKQTGVYDYVESAAGAYGPAIKTTNLIIKTYSGEDKKEADAIQRQKDVKNIRIPLEVLGNAGFIPLYKDIRKEVMKEIYKGIEKGPSTKKGRVMSQEEYDRLTK